jgi:hypothetical protein
MAKQTFTTGQVLTAAQMTSLQETAMGGGPATAKTANYVLVAADAGTTVAMDAAGATTITVNTGLFAAGDTVFIQNLGAGACTVTAGTATVATAGSLILPQNDAGILYFTSASAAIFYDYIQVGATSPLTTKGDLYTFGTSDTRLPVGTNGHTLVADSSTATGLKWAAPAGGGKVLQVVQVSYSTEYTNTSTTYTDTGLSASITPSATNSKILITVIQQTWSKRQTNNSGGVGLKILRGATDIFVQSPNRAEAQYSEVNNATGAVEIGAIISLCYLDSPSTTSSTTYKTQGACNASTSTPTMKCQQGSAISTITLMEIGA